MASNSEEVHNFDYEYTKVAFYQEVGYLLLEKKLQNKIVLRRKNIENIISDKNAHRRHYKKYFTEKCQIVNQNGQDVLCQVTVKRTGSPFFLMDVKQILCLSDLFNVLCELHMCKPNLKETEIMEYCTNVLLFNSLIFLFWKSCEACTNMLKGYELTFRMIGEMTVFAMSSPDEKFCDIFMYLERNTNFVLLRPLKSLSNKELAYELLTIFCDFGGPVNLDSNIFKYSFKDVLKILKSVDPPFKIPAMFTVSRNHKVFGATRKAKQLLTEWMTKTGSTNWAIGAHIVQWQMNTSKVVDTYIRSKRVNGPIQSPYHAFFGFVPQADIMKIKQKPKLISTNSKKIVELKCSQCGLHMFKPFKCHFCQKLFHFSCCIRYVEQSDISPLLINRCVSCPGAEETILGA